jgi:hypothetical protein
MKVAWRRSRQKTANDDIGPDFSNIIYGTIAAVRDENLAFGIAQFMGTHSQEKQD